MATETDPQTTGPGDATGETRTPFGEVSRLSGIVFEYLTLAASMFGILSLGILLSYVFWDAFGLETADPVWYAVLVGTVGLPLVGQALYARRNPVAGEVALELGSTLLGGVLAGLALVVVLEVIAGSEVWFAYFLTTVLPLGSLYVYGRRNEATWVGLATLGVLIVGPAIGTAALGPLTTVAGLFGGPGIYFLSMVLPAALLCRYLVGEFLELGNGDYAAGATLALAVVGIPVVDTVGVARSVWLLFLVALVMPFGIVVAKNLAVPERRVGFVAPAVIIVGIGLLAVLPETVGVAGPSPWFDWQYVTSNPSRFADQAGLYPAIIGSVFMIVAVAILTLIIGVGTAVYLEEYAPSSGIAASVVRLIRINISNLAGVPSVVYGLLGLAVFANTLRLGFGTVVTAAFTLSLLILPIVIISSREAIRSVPDSLRDASYGMGATRWQTVRNVVMPRAIPGILTGTILALGRAIGETAPLIMIGVATSIYSTPSGLFDKISAMPMQIFVWASFPSEEFQYGVLAAGVVTLLVVLLTMNSIAILLRNKFEQSEI